MWRTKQQVSQKNCHPWSRGDQNRNSTHVPKFFRLYCRARSGNLALASRGRGSSSLAVCIEVYIKTYLNCHEARVPPLASACRVGSPLGQDGGGGLFFLALKRCVK